MVDDAGAVSAILHADLDAFFAAVEQRDDPSLRGKPVLVGGSERRGVVAAASYEARTFGVHSAMPMAEALRRCPDAVVLSHSWPRYEEASRRFFEILGEFTPLVESLSVDEAFLDVRGSIRLFGAPIEIARAIKDRVSQQINLVVSIGVAPTKFAAKIASDIDKPDGLRCVEPGGLLAFLHPLPVSRLWGVGAATQEKLAALGLHTIGAVAQFPEASLRARLGDNLAAHLCALARGHDPREVTTGRSAVTIGHEQTFDRDIGDAAELVPILSKQADRVAARLRRAELRARVVVLKIKFADFRQITRRRTLPDATTSGKTVSDAALELLAQVAIDDDHGKRARVRLCGVSVAGLEGQNAPRQLTLTEDNRDRARRLDAVVDGIADKFGENMIARAITMRSDDD